MKLCKDCKHYRKNIWTWQLAKCARNQKAAPQNLVTGSAVKAEDRFCDIAREFDHLCGLEAKWFEPAPARKWWQLW